MPAGHDQPRMGRDPGETFFLPVNLGVRKRRSICWMKY